VLKIDQSFASELSGLDASMAIVATAIELAPPLTSRNSQSPGSRAGLWLSGCGGSLPRVQSSCPRRRWSVPWKQLGAKTLPGVGIGHVSKSVYSPVTRAPFIHPAMTTPRIVAVIGLTPSFSVMWLYATKECLLPMNP
jgi:hypothetical protein